MKVNSSTLAQQIAETLDAKDKSGKNGKIEASVWNEFVKDKGGKTINNYINIEQAKNSLVVYLCRQAKAKKKLIVDLGREWVNSLGNAVKTDEKEEAEKQTVEEKKVSNTNLYPVDTSYSTLSRADALKRASEDPRLECLSGGSGWSVSTGSFVTDIPYAKKNTGKILSFISSAIGEELVVTSALGTRGVGRRRSPHRLTQNYCTHHNAENPKLDIKTNGHARSLKSKLAATGFFSRISIESDHLDIQIKPEIYAAFELGNSMSNILACAQNNTLESLLA